MVRFTTDITTTMNSYTAVNVTAVINTSLDASYDGPVCLNFSNLEDDEVKSIVSYTPGDAFFHSVFLPIVLVVGVLDNALFIYVVLRIPRMRTVTNCYLVGLSVADIIFLVFAIGGKLWAFASSPMYGDDYPLGLSGCQLNQFMVNTSYFVSLCFITLVSWERYNGVCRPHRRRDTKLRVAANVVLSTLVSCLLSASLLVSFSQEEIVCFIWPSTPTFSTWPDKRMTCLPNFAWADCYSYATQTVPFFLSLFGNTLLYYKIIRGLDQSIKRTQSNHRKGKDSTRNQVAKMLVINGVALFALLAPFEVMSIFNLVANVRDAVYILPFEARQGLAYFARVASYFNSIINPIIYTVLSSRYREAFQIALLPAACRPRPKGSDNATPGSTGRSGTMTTRAHESKM